MSEPTRTWPDGSVEYRDEHGEFHREDGPAVTWLNGYKAWWVHGQRHRTDGPAISRADGSEEWYLNGELHRADGPAHTEIESGYSAWYLHGQPHRVDGPAVVKGDGTTEWWVNGQRRTDIEDMFSAYETSVRVENADGSVEWRDRRGVCPRTDGPALIVPDGLTEWWIYGHQAVDVAEAIAALAEDNKDD